LSGWHIDVNQIRAVKIQSVKPESQGVKTFFLEDELCSSARPGQFVMVWIPGVDEIPLSLSSVRGKISSITVREVGEATHALNNMRKDEVIGVRGPFGTHFTIACKEALVVGGGIGTAPLMMLTTTLLDAKVKTTLVEGAKTRSELLFLDQLRDLAAKTRAEVVFTTDDGSYGIRGLATDAVEKILSSRKFDTVYACGNEAMIRKVFLMAKEHDTPLQASLERIMLCAMGICGSCVIGKYRVCKDGPVFDQTQLEEVEEELGRFKRDFKGKRVPI